MNFNQLSLKLKVQKKKKHKEFLNKSWQRWKNTYKKEFDENSIDQWKNLKTFALFISCLQQKKRSHRNFVQEQKVEKPIIDDLLFDGMIRCDMRLAVFSFYSFCHHCSRGANKLARDMSHNTINFRQLFFKNKQPSDRRLHGRSFSHTWREKQSFDNGQSS